MRRYPLSSIQFPTHNYSTSRRCRALTCFLATGPALFHIFFAWLLLSNPFFANGQAFLNNGQYFTKGLAISDAPFPGRSVLRQRQSLSETSDTVIAALNMQEAT